VKVSETLLKFIRMKDNPIIICNRDISTCMFSEENSEAYQKRRTLLAKEKKSDVKIPEVLFGTLNFRTLF